MLDGITKIKKTRIRAPEIQSKIIAVSKTPVYYRREPKVWAHSHFIAYSLILIAISFFGGFIYYAQTKSIQARQEENIFASDFIHQASLEQPALPGFISLPDVNFNGQAVEQLTNDVLFNMPITQLEYLIEYQGYKTALLQQEKFLNERIKNLKIYLENKKSPFAEIAAPIAKLKHFKLVLAVSNAESSLGRFCADNNCSGIGVEPNHPLWRKYENTAAWAKDLDKLLEKRYKNWSLEKMCGVYVQPCNENWLIATRQILEETKDIE